MPTPTVKKVQEFLGVKADGIWGPKSQKALNTEIGKTTGSGNPTLVKIQSHLGVKADGFWGLISQQALIDLIDGVTNKKKPATSGFKAVASSFADPADVTAFKQCKALGKSDLACFKVGDNGIGQFGKITAQTHTEMVAIHKDDMVAKWGSVTGAAHRLVTVTYKGTTITAAVEDRLGVPGRIDLNPAAAKQLGLNPPFLVKNCYWDWV